MPSPSRLLLVAALAAAVVAAATGALAALPTLDVEFEATEYSFDPDVITVTSGEAVSLTLSNAGEQAHNIVFELDGGRVVETSVLSPGEEERLDFEAPVAAGAYAFYCSVGNHRQLGMEGVLTVNPPDFEAVAEDLLNPRGLAMSGDVLLVGEGGTGEAGMGFVPGNGDGRVTSLKLSVPDQRTVVVDGLANAVDPGGGVVGANHALWRAPDATSGTVLVALSGGPGHPDPKAQILAGEPGEAFSVLVDVWAYEEANNPDGGEIDSNPWRMAHGADGTAYLSDAGMNAVLAFDTETGATTTYAVFEPVGEQEGEPIQPVPTGLVLDPSDDGVVYVSLLGSFAPGMGQVRRLEDKNDDGDAMDEGENELVRDGLTTAVDVGFTPDGRLFVLEFGGFPATGTLSEVPMTVPVGVSVPGLNAPSALAFTAEGDALVATGAGGGSWVTDRVIRIPAEMLGADAPTPTPETPTPEPDTPTPESDDTSLYLPLCLRGHVLER